MRIPANEYRAIYAFVFAVIDDGLCRRENVILIKGGVQRRPPVSRRAKNYLLINVLRIRMFRVIRSDKLGEVNKILGLS